MVDVEIGLVSFVKQIKPVENVIRFSGLSGLAPEGESEKVNMYLLFTGGHKASSVTVEREVVKH